MATPEKFAQRIRRMADQVEVQAGRIVAQTAQIISQTVILATPVDTGRARANWQIGIGSPVIVETPERDQAGATTIARNASKLAIGSRARTIFLSNNVDYIGDLNAGSSSQAPANFVEIAVQQGLLFLKRQRIIR